MLPPRSDAKAATEFPKALSEELQLDYFLRRGRLRRWRGPLGVVLAFGCLAAVLAVSSWPGGRRTFQAAPVSEAHAMFNDDCAACHTKSFRTAGRLVGGDEVRSVTDQACLHCHDGSIHHPRQMGTMACAACHPEHRGHRLLARVDDRHCTTCHADLASHTDPSWKSDLGRKVRDVSAFASGSHPPFDAWDGKRDPGTIRFSHQKHLKPEGVPVQNPSGRRILTCLDCHRPDEDRRYMQPIRYQRDCASCHPLSVPIEAELANEPARHPSPGESARTVRAELRDRLIRYIQGHPAALEGRETPEPERPIPGRDRRAVAPMTGTQWQWANSHLDRVERPLFDGAGGCRFCHTEVSNPTQRPEGLPQYAEPALTTRWFPQSTFNHDSHRALNCQECHAGTSRSDQSSKVLMPKIETCQRCHTSSSPGARSDCVECHAYHDRSKESRRDGGLKLDEVLTPSRRHGAGRSD